MSSFRNSNNNNKKYKHSDSPTINRDINNQDSNQSDINNNDNNSNQTNNNNIVIVIVIKRITTTLSILHFGLCKMFAWASINSKLKVRNMGNEDPTSNQTTTSITNNHF
ncbi:hypothetical protein ACTA71_005086 [Dictyostelium dimigraforme]